ncbi:hypothetical protein EHV10_02250 [Lachnoanaerobaculum gingivalis]|jgi:hypothetical protein|uniref:Uncharacterized protein n=1 Tax=Lachnoanaerobaculum gingivalis TaxID=2490855 RepID=A0A3P3R084_9FIRM|nr:hypothetical protein [Lachnoanaerobaculum gingivalis]RRJ26857.1 hypothetical protein EHV10_02250 [Lachnoanaerobaculum gingivalis]
MRAMVEFLSYLSKGFAIIFESDIYKYFYLLCIAFSLFYIFRKAYIVAVSGGDFFAPYHISNGYFYIYNIFYLGKRKIALEDIKSIAIGCNRRKGYRIYEMILNLKSGKSAFLHFEKNKSNINRIEVLESELERYKIDVKKDNDV